MIFGKNNVAIRLKCDVSPPLHLNANRKPIPAVATSPLLLKEKPVRWIPFFAFFLYVYVEISIFIQVAHVLGVLLTLVLILFTSVIGMSLVRNQGFKNFMLMQQKMAAGESPAAEMIKSVSIIIAGLLLLLPGFFTDLLGLLLLLPPVQNHLTVKLMPYLRFSAMSGGGFSGGNDGGNTFDGEYQRKDDERDRLDHKDDR
jgi:UPF0716 protein FxsA